MKKILMALIVVFISVITVVAFLRPLNAPVNHDENLFMASAYLLASAGLQPYRDYAYFHMPNLVYIYSLFFLTPFPFLLARAFVALCSVALLTTIGFVAFRQATGESRVERGLIALAVVALLSNSPVYVYTSLFVWNHFPSILCLVWALLAHLRGLSKPNAPSGRFLFLSGALLGMAVGIRLSFAPMVIPFLLAFPLCMGRLRREMIAPIGAFGSGGLITNLPALYFLVTQPSDFLFGNLGYARLNTLFRETTGHEIAMTLMGKCSYARDFVFSKPGDLLICFVLAVALICLGLSRWSVRSRAPRSVEFLLICLPFVLIGSLAPTPSWYQYFFAPVPVAVLLLVYLMHALGDTAHRIVIRVLIFMCAIFSLGYQIPLSGSALSKFERQLHPKRWTPVKVQRDANKLREKLDALHINGPVLTLSPLYVIAADIPIYPEFTTGPFAWRVSHLVPLAKARQYRLPVPDQMGTFLDRRQTEAILIGKERAATTLEDLLRKRNWPTPEYAPMRISDRAVLWVKADLLKIAAEEGSKQDHD